MHAPASSENWALKLKPSLPKNSFAFGRSLTGRLTNIFVVLFVLIISIGSIDHLVLPFSGLQRTKGVVQDKLCCGNFSQRGSIFRIGLMLLSRSSVSCSVSARHHRRLLSGFGRIKEEFEGVVILILFHKLEVDEPLGFPHGLTVREPASG